MMEGTHWQNKGLREALQQPNPYGATHYPMGNKPTTVCEPREETIMKNEIKAVSPKDPDTLTSLTLEAHKLLNRTLEVLIGTASALGSEREFDDLPAFGGGLLGALKAVTFTAENILTVADIIKQTIA